MASDPSAVELLVNLAAPDVPTRKRARDSDPVDAGSASSASPAVAAPAAAPAAVLPPLAALPPTAGVAASVPASAPVAGSNQPPRPPSPRAALSVPPPEPRDSNNGQPSPVRRSRTQPQSPPSAPSLPMPQFDSAMHMASFAPPSVSAPPTFPDPASAGFASSAGAAFPGFPSAAAAAAAGPAPGFASLGSAFGPPGGFASSPAMSAGFAPQPGFVPSAFPSAASAFMSQHGLLAAGPGAEILLMPIQPLGPDGQPHGLPAGLHFDGMPPSISMSFHPEPLQHPQQQPPPPPPPQQQQHVPTADGTGTPQPPGPPAASPAKRPAQRRRQPPKAHLDKEAVSALLQLTPGDGGEPGEAQPAGRVPDDDADDKARGIKRLCHCTKRARYGLPGGQRERCGLHKEPEHINLYVPLCHCGTQANFGPPRGKKQRCAAHREPGHVDLTTNQRCHCGKRASYGPIGGQRVRCSLHKEEGQISLASKLCHCGRQASFGPPCGSRSRCAEHKEPTDQYMKSHYCHCGVQASYGPANGKRARCAKHKLATDVDLRHPDRWRNKAGSAAENAVVPLLATSVAVDAPSNLALEALSALHRAAPLVPASLESHHYSDHIADQSTPASFSAYDDRQDGTTGEAQQPAPAPGDAHPAYGQQHVSQAHSSSSDGDATSSKASQIQPIYVPAVRPGAGLQPGPQPGVLVTLSAAPPSQIVAAPHGEIRGGTSLPADGDYAATRSDAPAASTFASDQSFVGFASSSTDYETRVPAYGQSGTSYVELTVTPASCHATPSVADSSDPRTIELSQLGTSSGTADTCERP